MEFFNYYLCFCFVEVTQLSDAKRTPAAQASPLYATRHEIYQAAGVESLFSSFVCFPGGRKNFHCILFGAKKQSTARAHILLSHIHILTARK